MSSKNPFFLLFLITLLCLLPPSSSSPSHHLHHHIRHLGKPKTPPTQFPSPLSLASQYGLNLPTTEPATQETQHTPLGQWSKLQTSLGISAMHMQLLHNNKVVIFDRTDFGASNLSLPVGKCRFNDEALLIDCTAHSILYDIDSNSFRPLMVQTDVWCSSASTSPDGVLIQTGGYHNGDNKIRTFEPCNDENCDWVELQQNLSVRRWYATNQLLPDGRVIIVGGRKQFSYEFFPKNVNSSEVFYLSFLQETTDVREENNLYPFLHLLPSGNLFLFTNQRSIVLDYVNNVVVREFPMIPREKRNYPATGSSVMLPLQLAGAGDSPAVEVMVCGGAKGGAYIRAGKGTYMAASKSCGRLKVTDPFPFWAMENMPSGRVMSDMLLLPTGDVIILNGARRGTAGWECAIDPVLHPLLYKPREADTGKRFVSLNPTDTPRLYHSSAILLPDGRILVGGSNPHVRYNFTGVMYPTDLSLEEFKPPYMDSVYDHLRPSVFTIEGLVGNNIASYGQQFSINVMLPFGQNIEQGGDFMVTMMAPSFTTHSFAMNQRLLELEIVDMQLIVITMKITVRAPPTANVAPPGYYLLFVVHDGIPGKAVWIKMVKN